MTITMAKEDRINIRVSSEVKSLLTRAAKTKNVSVSEFIVESAVQEAHETILDRSLFVLPAEDFDQLAKMLEPSEENNRRIENLLNRSKPGDD